LLININCNRWFSWFRPNSNLKSSNVSSLSKWASSITIIVGILIEVNFLVICCNNLSFCCEAVSPKWLTSNRKKDSELRRVNDKYTKQMVQLALCYIFKFVCDVVEYSLALFSQNTNHNSFLLSNLQPLSKTLISSSVSDHLEVFSRQSHACWLCDNHRLWWLANRTQQLIFRQLTSFSSCCRDVTTKRNLSHNSRNKFVDNNILF